MFPDRFSGWSRRSGWRGRIRWDRRFWRAKAKTIGAKFPRPALGPVKFELPLALFRGVLGRMFGLMPCLFGDPLCVAAQLFRPAIELFAHSLDPLLDLFFDHLLEVVG